MIKLLIFYSFLVVSIFSCAFAYSENDISRLEFQKYGRCYEDDSLAERLSRLENDYLGMTQSGDIDKRVYNLLTIGKSTSNGFESYDDFNQEQVPVQKKGKLKTFWNNISSGLNDMGSMTGFIPPLTTYSNYNGYSPYYNGNGYWNSYNPNSYSNDPFHNNHIYHRGCIQHPHNYFNPINNRIVNRINSNLYNNRYYNGVIFPNMYPYQNSYYPTNGYTNYSTRSTVTILND